MLDKLQNFFSNKTNAISAAIGWIAVLGIVGSIINIALLNGYDVVENTVKTKTTYTTVTETTAGGAGSLLDNLRESLTMDGSTQTGTGDTYYTTTTTTPSTTTTTPGYTSPATLAAKRIIRNHLRINPFDFDLETLKVEFGVTDSSTFGRLNAHDVAVVYDPKTKMYYSYGTDAEIGVGLPNTVLGLQVRKSKDLVNWEYVGHAIPEAEAEAIYILQNYNYKTSYANGQHSFWAPDVQVIYDEATGTYKYRMYFSCTATFGSQHSVIYVAESDNPAGGFTLNRNGSDIVGLTVKAFGINKSDLVASGLSGVTLSVADNVAYNQAQAIRKATEVVNSYEQSTYNAIDPSLCYSYAADGKTVTGTYLSYGSFFGGIQVRQLDPATGLTLGGSTDVNGTLIAKVNVPSGNDVNGPEGSSILYHDGYYYLFLSYGDLYSTYDVRVGRSTSITGPYTDYDGVDLTVAKEVKDQSSKKNVNINSGTKLMCSYYFKSSVVGGYSVHGNGVWSFAGFIAPGHGTWFYDKDGNVMFAHHTREGGSKSVSGDTVRYNNHYLVIRAMDFITADGSEDNTWPVLSPGWYDGEDISTTIPQSQIYGSWEYIVFTKGSTTPKMSNTMTINKDGTVNYGDVKGTWTYSGRNLVINLDTGVTLTAKVMAGWDIENSKETILISGIDDKGIAHWAKKTYN